MRPAHLQLPTGQRLPYLHQMAVDIATEFREFFPRQAHQGCLLFPISIYIEPSWPKTAYLS